MGPSAGRGSSASEASTATGGLTRETSSISNLFLFTVVDIVARSFTVKAKSVNVAPLTFLSFHLVEEVKIYRVPSRRPRLSQCRYRCWELTGYCVGLVVMLIFLLIVIKYLTFGSPSYKVITGWRVV